MKRYALFFLAGFVWVIGTLAAQEPSRGPDGGTSFHVSGVELLAIPGKPFSAKTSTEWTRTLADGRTITTHLEASLARDRRGRIYRENHTFVPANSDRKAPLNEIHLSDPVTWTQAFCSIRAMQCILKDYYPTTFFRDRATGPNATGTRSRNRESLGLNVIEGIPVSGTRETITVNPGVLGNEQPIVSTLEFWYSDELQTNLAVIRNDPMAGRQVIRLSNISVTDPDPHLFDLPIGYSIRDMRTSALRKK